MRTTLEYATLRERPQQWFMSLRDMPFWIQSARADASLAKLMCKHDVQSAFHQLYSQNPDPWGFTNPRYRYQRLKYERLLALLPAREYASALDVGCGIGMFTRCLAPYVKQITGIDIALAAVQQARRLPQDMPSLCYHQEDLFAQQDPPQQQPSGRFDLVVLVDVLYYVSPLTDERLAAIVANVGALLTPNATLLLANHYFCGLDRQSRLVRHIHRAFRKASFLHLVHEEVQPFFLASVFQKVQSTGEHTT